KATEECFSAWERLNAWGGCPVPITTRYLSPGVCPRTLRRNVAYLWHRECDLVVRFLCPLAASVPGTGRDPRGRHGLRSDVRHGRVVAGACRQDRTVRAYPRRRSLTGHVPAVPQNSGAPAWHRYRRTGRRYLTKHDPRCGSGCRGLLLRPQDLHKCTTD